jgi:serine/threonine protein kinase
VHPNVAQVLDVGQHDGVPYLVMSLVDGKDFGEHLAQYAPMPVADIVDCILPIVRGGSARRGNRPSRPEAKQHPTDA